MNISAVLLAGGESRRFGQDKALFSWNGQPLWARQLATLRGANAGEILLSARADPKWRPPDVKFVRDAAPFCGPLGGLLASLDDMSASHLLVLAIDMPLMTSFYLRGLMEEARPGRGVLPLLHEKAEPLAAVYPVEAEALLREMRASGEDYSLQRANRILLQAGRMQSISVRPGDEFLFQNLNRFADTTRAPAARLPD
jgi:molybdenum cofactor guanylyltransferase